MLVPIILGTLGVVVLVVLGCISLIGGILHGVATLLEIPLTKEKK